MQLVSQALAIHREMLRHQMIFLNDICDASQGDDVGNRWLSSPRGD